jgi:hypothetical protein
VNSRPRWGLGLTTIVFAATLLVFAGHAGARATAASCGAAPTGNLSGWRQIFRDDFTTDVPLGSFPSAVSSRWWAYPSPWRDTSHNGTYAPQQVLSVHDGVLDIYLHTENGVHLVSAPVPILQPGPKRYGSGLLYGRYTVCFKADPVVGYKTAWLLWPDSGNWPTDGEIDFPEGQLSATITAALHHQGGKSPIDQDLFQTTATYTSWHVATIEWTAKTCRFYLDGAVIGTSRSRIPQTPMHWVIQTETDTTGVVPSDSASGHVLLDWAAAYVPA